MARRSPFSVFMLWTTVAILAVWLLWAALDPLIAGRVFSTFRAFGLVSPLVALVCLALSVAAFAEARVRVLRGPIRLQRGEPAACLDRIEDDDRAATWQALAAILLSVVIGAAPFFSLPYDPS
jgi:hypothetical protein